MRIPKGALGTRKKERERCQASDREGEMSTSGGGGGGGYPWSSSVVQAHQLHWQTGNENEEVIVVGVVNWWRIPCAKRL